MKHHSKRHIIDVTAEATAIPTSKEGIGSDTVAVISNSEQSYKIDINVGNNDANYDGIIVNTVNGIAEFDDVIANCKMPDNIDADRKGPEDTTENSVINVTKDGTEDDADINTDVDVGVDTDVDKEYYQYLEA